MTPVQGDIWWLEAEGDRRPALVVTRDAAISVLNRIVIAPVTRTIRGIPTEVRLGTEEGLRDECVASFDNMRTVGRALLTERIGSLALAHVHICRALVALADC